MADDWTEAPLGELVQNFDSKRVPLSSRERAKRRGPYPYYGATGVMDYVDSYLFEGLHLLVAEDGSVERTDGTPFLQLVSGTFWVNNHAHVLRGATDEDTRFLYYALSMVAIRPYMSGSVQDKLSQGNLNKILVPYPRGEATRRDIARILGALDDKIQLNRRISETLEAIARALFRSWFVDFDPVRAKADGRNVDLPARLADLFPESFAESPLGGIPNGWACVPLGDQVEVVRGLSYNGSGLRDGGLPMLNLNSIYEGGGYKDEGLKRYAGPFEQRHVVCSGDLIVANTEQGHHCLLIGYAAIVPSFTDEQSIYSHHLYRVRPRQSSPLTTDYLCHLLNSRRMHDVVSGYANGTTVNMLPGDALSRPLVAIPPPQLLDEFDRVARFVRESSWLRRAESASLSALRDALLPKLISGDLRISVAERRAEATA